MAIKKYNPTSPARRFMTVSDFAEITKKSPERSLLAKKDKHAGRNSYGRITVRHRGGGNRRKYRIIDFKRNKDGMPQLSVLNTIRTEVPISLLFNMKTAKRLTSSLLSVLQTVTS